MIDLGDVQQLTFTNTDDAGAPADGGTVAVTVTLPDGTTSQPNVVHVSAGVYTADYTTVQAGRHLVHWVSTGTNPGAYSDVFTVAAADPGFLIGLDQARKAIGLAPTNTAKDGDLRLYLEAAVPIIEDLVGPVLTRSCDEWHDGGADTVALLYPPLLSVTLVTEGYAAGYVRTLTEQPLTSGTSFDSYGYTVDLASGMLTRRVSGVAAPFVGGRRNIHVNYRAGQTLQGNQVLGVRRLIRHLWQSEQQGQRPDFSSPDTAMGYTPSGFAVPRAVIELMAASQRAPGIA